MQRVSASALLLQHGWHAVPDAAAAGAATDEPRHLAALARAVGPAKAGVAGARAAPLVARAAPAADEFVAHGAAADRQFLVERFAAAHRRAEAHRVAAAARQRRGGAVVSAAQGGGAEGGGRGRADARRCAAGVCGCGCLRVHARLEL